MSDNHWLRFDALLNPADSETWLSRARNFLIACRPYKKKQGPSPKAKNPLFA